MEDKITSLLIPSNISDELRLYILQLRQVLLDLAEENKALAEENKKLSNRLEATIDNFANKQLYDYKTRKYFDFLV